jgi:hypothetical protein
MKPRRDCADCLGTGVVPGLPVVRDGHTYNTFDMCQCVGGVLPPETLERMRRPVKGIDYDKRYP